MVLVERVWQRTTPLKDVCLALGGVALLAVTAQVEIPLWPVPVTGQTFGVLLLGALYGSRRGALATALYVAVGAAGLPVFAGGAGGVARLFGPTGGYLAGFVAAAWVVGRLSEGGWDRRPAMAVAAMLAGTAVIYAFGLLWLSAFVGPSRAVAAGLVPFVVGDALKIALAAAALPCGWKLLGREDRGR